MSIEIQVFEKGPTRTVLAWEQEDRSAVKSFNLYISLIPGTSGFSLIKSKITNVANNDGVLKGHVGSGVTEEDIRNLGGDFANFTFEADFSYFRVTEITPADAESPLADATTRAVGPIGVRTMLEQDDERKNNHNYGFSVELNSWHRQMASSYGSLSVTSSGLYEDNLTIDRVIDGGGNVTSELVYITGSRSGTRAKLYTYTGPFSSDGKATNTVVSESVVP